MSDSWCRCTPRRTQMFLSTARYFAHSTCGSRFGWAQDTCVLQKQSSQLHLMVLVSHSLPLHFALHRSHYLRLHITVFTDGSATPRACGSTGRIADNTHTPQYQEFPSTRWPVVCGKDVHTVIFTRTLSFRRMSIRPTCESQNRSSL